MNLNFNRNEVTETIVQYQFVLDHLHLLKGKVICDIGVGPNPSLWYMLNSTGFLCFGIDLKERVESERFGVMDIVKDRPPSEKFDGVFCLDSIHSFEDKDQAVFNMIRITKPEGIIFIATPFLNVTAEDISRWIYMIGEAISVEDWKVWTGDKWREGQRLPFPKRCFEKADMVMMAVQLPPASNDDMKKINYKLDDSWYRYHSKDPQWQSLRDRYDWIVSQVETGPVLDIGCGPGVTCQELRKKDFNVTGIDYSDKIIRIAQARGGRFIWGRAEALPFSDDEFNTVILTETLEHVEDLKKSLQEADRVAKSGAKIIISVPNGGVTSRIHLRTFTEETLRNSLLWPVEKIESSQEWIRVICRKS